MWVIIKSNKNELEVLKSSLKHNFAKTVIFIILNLNQNLIY